MARSHSTRPRRHAPRRPKATAPSPAAATTLDPALEKQLMRLVGGYMLRTILLFILVSVLTEVVIVWKKVPNLTALTILPLSTVGVMIPFLRGADRVFRKIMEIGRQKLKQRRFADAQFAFQYFHRFGNMSFDIDGEGHCHLAEALIGLGDLEQAQRMVVWLQKHRRRSGWTVKAVNILANAERARSRAETQAPPIVSQDATEAQKP